MTQKIVHCVMPEQVGTADNEDVEQPGWYFWDETWAHRHGPFATRAEAEMAVVTYCAELNGRTTDEHNLSIIQHDR